MMCIVQFRLFFFSAFSSIVLFKRGCSLVIMLSPSIICWPLKKSDYPLVAPRIFCVTSMAGIVFKLSSLDHAVEYAVGFCMLKR